MQYISGKWINQNKPESTITNLTSDLLNCERIPNKNTANGYCPLDQNSLVPLINIPYLFLNYLNFLIVSPSNNQLIYYNNSAG